MSTATTATTAAEAAARYEAALATNCLVQNGWHSTADGADDEGDFLCAAACSFLGICAGIGLAVMT